MTDDTKIDESANPQRAERRPYEAPAVKDFFQPLVVLGTTTQTFACAAPKPPKH